MISTMFFRTGTTPSCPSGRLRPKSRMPAAHRATLRRSLRAVKAFPMNPRRRSRHGPPVAESSPSPWFHLRYYRIKLTNTLSRAAYFPHGTLILLCELAPTSSVAIQTNNLRRLLHTVEALSELGPALTAYLGFSETSPVSRLGMPYVWGAAGPTSFDCSGLVQWSFAQAGVVMPRVAAAQALTGPAIPIRQAQPGDLLFYRTDPTAPDYISHVAIYLGRGWMIHAPEPGENVQVVPV